MPVRTTLIAALLCAAILVTSGVRAQQTAAPASGGQPIIRDEAPPELREITSRLWDVAFSPDAKRLAVCAGWIGPREPGELTVWDLENRREVFVLRQFQPIRSVIFSRDGKQLLVGDFGGLTRLFDPATGNVLATLPRRVGIVNSAVFTPDEKAIIFGCFDGTVTLWDIATKRTKYVFLVPSERIIKVAVSPDGEHLAAVSQTGKGHVWNLPKRQKLRSFDASQVVAGRPPQSAEAIVFAPDGKSFATAGHAALRLWDTATGKMIREFSSDTFGMNALFTKDGKQLLCADGDGGVSIHTVSSGERIARWDAHDERCSGLALSKDERLLATASWDYTIKLWNLDKRELTGTLTRKKP